MVFTTSNSRGTLVRAPSRFRSRQKKRFGQRNEMLRADRLKKSINDTLAVFTGILFQ